MNAYWVPLEPPRHLSWVLARASDPVLSEDRYGTFMGLLSLPRKDKISLFMPFKVLNECISVINLTKVLGEIF